MTVNNYKLKDMKLIFRDNGDTWDKIIEDMNGREIFSQRGLKLFPEMRRRDYFDSWEKQIRQLPMFKIVECERFI